MAGGIGLAGKGGRGIGLALEKELFEQVKTLAGEMQISRSRVFGLALAEFLHRRNKQLLQEQISAA